jgi:hypothetical protein
MLHLALAAHAPVDVDVSALGDDPGAQRLHGDLIVRLLEEGWAIGIGDDAIVVRVRAQGDGRTVLVEHRGIVVRRSVEAGPSDAMYLELMHTVLEIVRELEPVPIAPPRSSASFEIELELRDPPVDDRALDPALVRAVVDAGGFVVRGGAADWRLCVGRSGATWSYARVPAARACDRAPAGPRGSREEVLAAIAADVREQSRERGRDSRPTSQTTETELAPISRRDAVDTEGTRARGRLLVWSSAGAGVSTRGRSMELAIPLALGVAHRSGFGAMLRGAVLSGRTRDDLHVLDATVAGGPAFHRPLGSRVAIGVAVLVGALLHRYRHAGERPRVEAAAGVEMPLWTTFRVTSGLTIGIGVDLGLGGTRWSHVVGSRTVWTRPSFRFGAGVTLGWCWGWS